MRAVIRGSLRAAVEIRDIAVSGGTEIPYRAASDMLRLQNFGNSDNEIPETVRVSSSVIRYCGIIISGGKNSNF